MTGEQRRPRSSTPPSRCSAGTGSGTTTKALAKAAGVSEGTIFKHFPTKDAPSPCQAVPALRDVAGAVDLPRLIAPRRQAEVGAAPSSPAGWIQLGRDETWRPWHPRVEETPRGCRSNGSDRRSRAHALTDATVDDATTGVVLIETVNDNVTRVTADAAYDTVAFYDAAGARGATVVVPPAKTARLSRRRPRSSARDRTINDVQSMGRRRWKKTSRYHQQARVENAFFRYKSIIGDALRARTPGGRTVEALLACNMLNRMTEMGRPASYAIGR